MSFTPKDRYDLVDKTISTQDIEDLIEWLKTDPRLTQGELVRAFEKEFAKAAGTAHAVFVNSGSSANLLAWFFPIAFDRPAMAENRRVIVPASAWATSVMPAIQFGYEPILCETDEETWGLDIESLRAHCEKAAPSIVLVVHQLGVPAKMKELEELRDEFGFLLIEDACGAFGSDPVAKVGEVSTFSTYYGHQLSTIEGGMVCMNGDAADTMFRMLRAHGWAADILDAETKKKLAEDAEVEAFREKFTFYVPGFNVRATDLQARIGLAQLRRADATAKARKLNHAHYFSRFAGAKHFAIQKAADTNKDIASIAFGVLAESKEHRAKVAAALAEKKIETRPIGGGNMARHPFWKNAYGDLKRPRPFADRLHDCGFQLPNNPGLGPEDIDFIADIVLAVTP